MTIDGCYRSKESSGHKDPISGHASGHFGKDADILARVASNPSPKPNFSGGVCICNCPEVENDAVGDLV